MSAQSSTFFKKTPVLNADLNQFRKEATGPGSKVRVLPNHPMSVADSYLYIFSNEDRGNSRLGELGGLEVGVGAGYQKNLNDIVHIHTLASYVYKNGALHKI